MNCPTCGAVNQPGAAFCSQCATNLLVPPGQALPPPPPQQPYGYGQDPAYYAPVATRTSGMAIAGFVLSFFCSLLGLIFSILGYNECKKSNGTVTGEGLALAGIIISIIGMLLAFVFWGSAFSHRGRF